MDWLRRYDKSLKDGKEFEGTKDAFYAAALRQYNKYGRGHSMKKFWEDEGYDYWKFCKLARDGQLEMESKSGTDKRPRFIELNPDGTQSPATAEEPLKVCEIKIRFNNGLILR